MSWLVRQGYSAKFLRDEIAACEVVCVNCHRRRSAQRGDWWRLDPDRLADSHDLLPTQIRNLAFVGQFLIGSACVDCGLKDILVLEFDHVSEKQAHVPQLARWGCSLKRLKREIARCEVRCANCHRRRTIAARGAAEPA
jgi:hypothetical protein